MASEICLFASEQEGYTINLESNNIKNELHQAVDASNLDDSDNLSDCLYMDADNTQKYPITKLVSPLTNYKNSETPINPVSKVSVLTSIRPKVV